MANRFYTNLPLGPGEVTLTDAEAHHLAHAARRRVGDRVTLFNGDGNDYRAAVAEVAKKSVTLTIDAVEPAGRETPFPVWVAAALPKGDRADYLVEKLTELGVHTIVPLRTARSVVEPRDAKLDRLRRAAVEACKQCGRSVLPTITELTDFPALLALPGLPAWRAVAHPLPGAVRLPSVTARGGVVAIGPEGGLTEAEVAEAIAAGWVALSLGPRIQRVETAAACVAGWLTQWAE